MRRKVKYKLRHGYGGYEILKGEGILKKAEYWCQFIIDISPNTFREDMGRFGTRETSEITVDPTYQYSGDFKGCYLLAESGVSWAFDYPEKHDVYVLKIED